MLFDYLLSVVQQQNCLCLKRMMQQPFRPLVCTDVSLPHLYTLHKQISFNFYAKSVISIIVVNL